MVAVTYGVTAVPAAKPAAKAVKAAERALAAPRKSFFVRFMTKCEKDA